MEAIKACGWYHDFLEIILLLIRKLLEHESLMVKLMSSLRKFYDPLSFFDFRFLITALVSSHFSQRKTNNEMAKRGESQ